MSDKIEMIKCSVCDSKGYIEMGAYDPDETCEECDGLGALMKQLNIDELREQFKKQVTEESNISGDYYNFDLKDSNGEYTQRKLKYDFQIWLSCARANNLIKDTK